jgi:nucleoid-associated protein YgaU
MPKSLLQRLGDTLGGAEQAAKNKEEAARQEAESARQQAEAAREEAERLRQEAEARAAEAQRQLEEKTRQMEAEREGKFREEMEVESRRLYAKEEAKAKAARTYVVQSGDTLSDIAQAMYGDAGRWPAIFEANKDKLRDPNLIHPGQELRIP